MLETIIESFISIAECTILIYFVTKFLGSKFNDKRKFYFFLLFLSIDISIALFRDYYGLFNGLVDRYAIFLYFIYAIMCLKGSYSKKAFVCLLSSLLTLLTNVVIPSTVSFISGIPLYDMVNNFTAIRISTLFLTKIVLLIASMFILQFNKKLYYELTNMQYNYLIILEITSIIIFNVVINNAQHVSGNQFNEFLYICTYMGIIGINILVFILLNRTNELNEEKTNNMLLTQQNDFQSNYVENAIKIYDEIRHLKHDFKNHLETICILVDNGEYKESKEYVSSLISEKIDSVLIMVNSGNRPIDAILASKMSFCNNSKIKFTCNILCDLKGIPSMDICTILANALDNAIEASKSVKNSEIELIIERNRNFLSVTVKNRIEKSVLDDNPDLKSTKTNEDVHGIGIKSMKSVAEKYYGSVDYSEKRDMFCCNILMQIFD